MAKHRCSGVRRQASGVMGPGAGGVRVAEPLDGRRVGVQLHRRPSRQSSVLVIACLHPALSGAGGMAPDGVYAVLPLMWLQGGSERTNPCVNTLMARDVSSLPLALVTFTTIGVRGWRSSRGQRQGTAMFKVLTGMADQPPVKSARQIARVVHQLR